jgi:hypothetical protein
MGFEGGQFTSIGLLDADRDFATQFGEHGLLVQLLQEAHGGVDDLLFRGEAAILHEGPYESRAVF